MIASVPCNISGKALLKRLKSSTKAKTLGFDKVASAIEKSRLIQLKVVSGDWHKKNADNTKIDFKVIEGNPDYKACMTDMRTRILKELEEKDAKKSYHAVSFFAIISLNVPT